MHSAHNSAVGAAKREISLDPFHHRLYTKNGRHTDIALKLGGAGVSGSNNMQKARRVKQSWPPLCMRHTQAC